MLDIQVERHRDNERKHGNNCFGFRDSAPNMENQMSREMKWKLGSYSGLEGLGFPKLVGSVWGPSKGPYRDCAENCPCMHARLVRTYKWCTPEP